jgi:hypothetical protein
LIDLTINEGMPIKQAARRTGVGVRTVYDWLARARCDDAPAELAEWARTFSRFVEWYREDTRRERYFRDRKAARLRWQRFKRARVDWWRDRLGESAFWKRRLEWLAERGKWHSYEQTVARLRSQGYRVTEG